jgi:hypothetical protein
MAFRDATLLNKRVSGLERNRPPAHAGGVMQVASETITSAAAADDVLRFLRLPVGSTLYGGWLVGETGISADMNADFGYASVSGVAGVTDADYFGATLFLDVSTFNRATLLLPPVVVNDDVYITVTLNSDGLGASKWVQATVFYTLPVA